jgi:D-3-phosphoglycerate dehydrogenase / 2-oxoglutarate reductase
VFRKEEAVPFKVVITDYYYPTLNEERRVFENTGIEIVDCNGKCGDEQQVIEYAKDADAVITHFVPITRRIIERLDKCRIIARYAVGLDTIDIPAATEKRIMVANVPDYCIEEVSDHAMALILALARKVPYMDRQVRKGIWNYELAAPMRRFSEMSLGLIAFGNIARRVAAKAEAFGFQRILVSDPYFADADRYPNYSFVSLDTLLAESDIVSIHAPAGAETKHLINRDSIGKMRQGALLVNTSRGVLIREGDLVEALGQGRLGGVALDVLEKEESTADHPLLRFENVILTPHMAWYSRHSIAELQRKVAEQVRQALLEGRPRYWVNRF